MKTLALVRLAFLEKETICVMRHLFLAYIHESAWTNLSPTDQQAKGQKFAAFVKEMAQRGIQELNWIPCPIVDGNKS